MTSDNVLEVNLSVQVRFVFFNLHTTYFNALHFSLKKHRSGQAPVCLELECTKKTKAIFP